MAKAGGLETIAADGPATVRQPNFKDFMSISGLTLGTWVVRRTDLFLLAMMAFAAAVASVPQPPSMPLGTEVAVWPAGESGRIALSGLDLSGNPLAP